MRLLIPYILGLLLLTASCGQVDNKTRNNEVIKEASNSSNSYTPTYYDYKNTTIKDNYADTIWINFSNASTVDCFTFYMPEGNINTTKSVLRITTMDGELIYENIFLTSRLVNGYATEEIENDKEMEEYLLTVAKQMLSKDSFRDLNNLTEQDGIIKQTEKGDYENYDVSVECKNENRPLYRFVLQEEDITFLGYSSKLKQVVIVLRCC